MLPASARSKPTPIAGSEVRSTPHTDYLSACDLSTALARLIPTVVLGDVKPKTAHTVASWPKLSCRPSFSESRASATRRNTRKVSFRAQRGACFFLLPPHLQLQRTPQNHALPTSHPLTPPVILSAAKDLIPSPQPHSLGRQRQPLSPTTHCRPPHSTPRPAPNRDPRALHFYHGWRLLVDGKPF